MKTNIKGRWLVVMMLFIMAGTVSAWAGVIGHWKFDDGSGTTATDSSSYGHNGTLYDLGADPWIAGIINGALDFSTTNRYTYVKVNNTAILQLTNDLTISLWIKPTAVGVRRGSLLHKSYGGEYSLTLEQDGSATFYQGKTATNYFGVYVVPGGAITNGVWQHLVVTRNMSTREIKGYVNGELKCTTLYPNDSAYSPPAATTDNVMIGAGYTWDYEGQIDDVSLADYPFSAVEIRCAYDISRLCGYWKFDDASGTAAVDSSPYEHNGVLYDLGAAPWIAGVINGALDFSTTNRYTYVKINNAGILQLTNDLTIALWVKPTTVGIKRCSLVHKSYGGEYSLALEQDGSATFYNGKSTTSGSYWGAYVAPAGSITNGVWQYLVVTRNMATREIKGYVNGEVKCTTNYPNNAAYSPPAATADNIMIGAGYTWDFEGQIDDVRLAGYPFSAEEIQFAYDSSSLHGYWKMDEGYGTVAQDSSIYGHHASFCNMSASPWMLGSFAHALSFDQSYDYIYVTNQPGLQLTNDLSIALWIKPTAVGVKRGNLVHKSYGGEYSLVLEQDGSATFYNGKSTTSGCYWGATVIPPGAITNDVWQHLVVTRNMATREIKGYVNGELKGLTNYPNNSAYSPPVASANSVMIGWGYTWDFNGQIQEVCLFSRVLSADDIYAQCQNQGGEYGFGYEGNPTGNPIGGGAGYTDVVDPNNADYYVTNTIGLFDALAVATTGQVVYVADAVELDLSGYDTIVIPGGVTLASGRGVAGSLGALLYTTYYDTNPLFFAIDANVRVTGLRLQGPHSATNIVNNYDLSTGIMCSKPGLEVDNCEIFGWPCAGIMFGTGATNTCIHHNYIHHCQQMGFGYGVCLTGGSESLVEANLFDYMRHSIASGGATNSDYEARFNLVLEHSIAHSFDVHGYNYGDKWYAGGMTYIHHNTFKTQYAVCIRGEPYVGAWIHNNWFDRDSSEMTVRQLVYEGAGSNTDVYVNIFTTNRVLEVVTCPEHIYSTW